MHQNDKRNLKFTQARKDRNWTQSYIAEKLGVEVRTVGRWEAGKTYPSPYTMRQICKLFGMSEEELGFVEQECSSTGEEVSVTPAELFSSEQTPSSYEPRIFETPIATVDDLEQATEQENTNAAEEVPVTPAELFSTAHLPSSYEPQPSETPTATVNDLEQATEQENPNTAEEVPVTSNEHPPSSYELQIFETPAATGNDPEQVTEQENTNAAKEVPVTSNELFSTDHPPSSCGPQIFETPAATGNDPERVKRYPRRALLLVLGTAVVGIGTVVQLLPWKVLLPWISIPPNRLVDPFPVKTQRFHTLQGHTAKVTSVAFTPDGKFLASGSWDTAVKIWNAYTGELHATYQHHSDNVSSVAWTSDGKYLASGSYDYTVKVLKMDTGEIVAEYSHEYKISSVAWSYDDRYLAAAGIGKRPEHPTIRVWDTKTSTSFSYANNIRNVHEVAWKPESDEYLASASDYDKVFVQDIYSLDSLPAIYSQHAQVNSVAWSPKHQSLPTQYLVSGGGAYSPGNKSYPEDTTVYVWNTMTGKPTTYKGHTKSVTSVRWSPSGKYIVSGGVDNAQVWEAMTGQPIACYTGHASYDDVGIDTVAWSPAGDQIASAGGWTAQDATIHLWGFLGPTDRDIV